MDKLFTTFPAYALGAAPSKKTRGHTTAGPFRWLLTNYLHQELPNHIATGDTQLDEQNPAYLLHVNEGDIQVFREFRDGLAQHHDLGHRQFGVIELAAQGFQLFRIQAANLYALSGPAGFPLRRVW